MPQQDLAFAQFEKLLAALPPLRHIELQGEGETLLHPRFLDMVSALRKRDIRVSLITNGSLVTPTLASAIGALGVEKVSVSMETADPETFQRIRGGKFDKVLAGLKALVAAKQQGARPLVGLSVTVLRQTRDHLPQILDLYEELGLDGGVTLQPLSSMPVYQTNYPPELLQQTLSPAEVDDLWVSMRFSKKLKLINKRKDRLAVRGFYDELLASFSPGQRKCPWLAAGLYVNRKGEATACCMIKDTAQWGLGVIGENRLEDILLRRQALADELATGRLPTPCQGCELGRFALLSRWQLVSFALGGTFRLLKKYL